MTSLNRATLVKVLEILGSSHADEALAAAKLASTMVREAGLSWDEVLAPVVGEAPLSNQLENRASGPFGYRRDRDLSAHEQFFLVLLSPRTPPEVKRRLQDWEARLLDGEITPQESQDLRVMYQNFVG